MDPGLVGQRIDHRYKLVREIGAGGMATVLEAIDTNLDKRVAVKLLNPCYRSDPILVARFQREAKAMARVRHPNLVDVTHHGLTDDGAPFLVMELLHGWDLLGELERAGGPLPWERAIGIAVQACGALSAAHGAGIIHRDIKPSNCFLAGIEGEGPMVVKLLDLGIAKILGDSDGDQLTVLSGGIPGTLHYMAPEQIRGEPVDARTDIYSLGIVLYRMLVGKLPFVDSKGATYEIMRMHCEDPPRSLGAAAPDAAVPASVEAVVLRALAKDPAERWQSAADLAAALVAAGDEGAVTTTSPPLARADQRRKTPTLALGLAAALVGVVGFGVSMSIKDESSVSASPSSSPAAAGEAERTGSLRAEAQVTKAETSPASPAESQHVEDHGPSLQLAEIRSGEGTGSARSADSPIDSGDAPLLCDHDPDAGHAALNEELAADSSEGARTADVPTVEPPGPTRAKKPRRRQRKAAPTPSPAELALTGELAMYGHKFKRCGDLLSDSQSRTISFGLTLEPRSGNVLEVVSDPKGAPELNACVASILRTMHFHRAPDGGEFEHLSVSL